MRHRVVLRSIALLARVHVCGKCRPSMPHHLMQHYAALRLVGAASTRAVLEGLTIYYGRVAGSIKYRRWLAAQKKTGARQAPTASGFRAKLLATC